jgi:hypothetical protein
MSFVKATSQPPLRDPEWSIPGTPQYEELAPGLYPDEVAVKLDDGTLVAISVAEEWMENNSGVHLQSWARWIKPDGETQTSPDGKQIESRCSASIGPAQLQINSIDEFRKEMLLAVLGEPPTLRDVPVDPNAIAVSKPEDPTFQHLPQNDKIPILPISEEGRLNSSIRHVVETIKQIREVPDPAQLLGL